ncbi:CheR family methyltransferase [Paracoccus laeviglucosivorans]|uniref:Chemotaxis protein methyltransferase CheR n=1 Tax=Paracoccus laeviglucosivorans TaxID=1197861 RepID=A0A521D2E1_9RHOB|nr:protein-glutamate O-methyltransferase CheR [Paracoccus laeviglucosivorans]SMO65854.1 chemotaxis protein methyltransferase CheR [Paracoccus laeviglucosivorans]
MLNEVQDFAALLYDRFGHDFRDYRPATLANRLQNLCARLRLSGIPALHDWLIRHPDRIALVVDHICIPVTELFREPDTLVQVREHVFPMLRSFPQVTVWHAGCAGGHEAFSMAILLHEAGILPRTRIFASDISSGILEKAATGRVEPQQIDGANARYVSSGGSARLADYFRPLDGGMKLDDDLLNKITFVQHNLATDAVFCEANLIFCCNVLIYFERQLQARALELFSDSLVRGGFLCLGQRETPIGAQKKFARLPGTGWIYRPLSQPHPQISRSQSASTANLLNDGKLK